MIGFIRGILLSKQPPKLLLDVQGLGYEVEAPMTTIYQLPEINQQVSLFTHLVIREDAQLLYGFSSSDVRDLFRILIKINGVGPKLALALLSVEMSELMSYIQQNNSAALTRIPGVGKKTAERLLIELKDKFAKTVGTSPVISASSDVEDAISALIALGYKPASAASAVKTVTNEQNDLSCSDIIKQALRQIK